MKRADQPSHCGKSKRLAEELLAAGYVNVRRYQPGMPVWRALGGVCEITSEGMQHVLGLDRTAVLIDARERDDYYFSETFKEARAGMNAKLGDRP